MKSKQVIVIGAGIAGISASVRLALKGYDVTVIEKNAYAGGKLTEIKQDGFRWDAGPSLFTLPKQVDELFELAGENPRDFFNYQRLPIICNYFWNDGMFLSASGDEHQFAKDVETTLGVKTKLVENYLKKSRFIYDTTAPVFLHQSLHKFRNYLNFKTLKGIVRMPLLGIFSILNNENQKQLKHPRLVQLFNRYATYNGSDPYLAPGVLQSIPHLEFGEGAWFPEGGMISITNSLVGLAKRCGVKFIFDTPVDEILVNSNLIEGVRCGELVHNCDLVVCNSDIIPAYRKLLAKQKAPEKILSQPRSSSALIFYWGMKGVFEQLDMHNIFFSDDYKREFELLTEGSSISEDPTVYVNITSNLRKEDAPERCSNWFVMINVPGDKGQDWDKLIDKSRNAIIKKLNLSLKTDIEELIHCESILDPKTIESKTSSFGGSLYGSSSNNRYAAFLRHANFSSQIKGLYFCGGSVHPGGGIPLCLQSARIVSDLIPNQ
ncbi:MAG: 1-hydroxycarotenoid 3,4-desaturase CrtD [Bacteroidia bacterium]